MPKLTDACRYIRSKNAGPFWITIDLFFTDDAAYRRYAEHPSIGADAVAALYGVEAGAVKRFAVPTLNVVKLSYPRTLPQGGTIERDMHGGQQYLRMVDIEL